MVCQKGNRHHRDVLRKKVLPPLQKPLTSGALGAKHLPPLQKEAPDKWCTWGKTPSTNGFLPIQTSVCQDMRRCRTSTTPVPPRHSTIREICSTNILTRENAAPNILELYSQRPIQQLGIATAFLGLSAGIANPISRKITLSPHQRRKINDELKPLA